MKCKYTCILVLSLGLMACSQPTFQSFYNAEKEEARVAAALPKYFAMIAIPGDAKEEVRYFTKGMKKIRLLYFDSEFNSAKPDFTSFADSRDYTPYIVIKEDGDNINVYTLEEEQHIREIVLDVTSEDDAFIIALMGKMDKRTFAEALEKASDSK